MKIELSLLTVTSFPGASLTSAGNLLEFASEVCDAWVAIVATLYGWVTSTICRTASPSPPATSPITLDADGNYKNKEREKKELLMQYLIEYF